MIEATETNAGTVRRGTRIRIVRVKTETTPSRAFPDGIDHQAEAMVGKEGTVEYIDSALNLHGTWGGLSLNPETDEIEILNQP